jgi:hypothetical protein
MWVRGLVKFIFAAWLALAASLLLNITIAVQS